MVLGLLLLGILVVSVVGAGFLVQAFQDEPDIPADVQDRIARQVASQSTSAAATPLTRPADQLAESSPREQAAPASAHTAAVQSRALAAPQDIASAPAAGAQPAAGPPAAARTILSEQFTARAASWPHDPQSVAWFAEGAYNLFARFPSNFVAIGAPITTSLRDVVVSGTFRKTGGPSGGGYGLIVRDQGPGSRDGLAQGGRYYVLEASDRGDVGIWRREENRWVDLLPWTPSDAVQKGDAVNQLTARAIGERLSLLVNGIEVATLVDSTLREGAVGVFVGGDLNEVAIEQFRVEVIN
jgi:hypothetical protein